MNDDANTAYLRGVADGEGFEREWRSTRYITSFILGLILGAMASAFVWSMIGRIS